MGVRARRIISGSEESKPSGGSCGRDKAPTDVPLGGSFIEARGVCDVGSLTFGEEEVVGSPCRRLDNILLRRVLIAEVRSSRGSMTSAVSRSMKSDWARAILGGEEV